jgi:hypothetical protein
MGKARLDRVDRRNVSLRDEIIRDRHRQRVSTEQIHRTAAFLTDRQPAFALEIKGVELVFCEPDLRSARAAAAIASGLLVVPDDLEEGATERSVLSSIPFESIFPRE